MLYKWLLSLNLSIDFINERLTIPQFLEFRRSAEEEAKRLNPKDDQPDEFSEADFFNALGFVDLGGGK